jgi:hypothetical protein
MVANDLDWDATPRKSRDNIREIYLHNDKLLDKNLKYRIFDFANCVAKYSRLSAGLRKEVIKYCATILFYDHGFKSVHGLSRLDRTWCARMEHSYLTGGNNHPLRAQNKGTKRYTDKFDAENPGRVLKPFLYTQRTIGNQALYADIARCTNNKTGADGITFNGNKSKFNSNNVYRWFRLQGGKEKSP